MSNETAKQEHSLALVLQAITRVSKLASSTKYTCRRGAVRYVEAGNSLTEADGKDAVVSTAQISKLMGHASVEPTMRHLNVEFDLDATISEFVPFQAGIGIGHLEVIDTGQRKPPDVFTVEMSELYRQGELG